MGSNIITTHTDDIVKSPKLSDLTYSQLLRREELRRVEEHVKSYFADMSK